MKVYELLNEIMVDVNPENLDKVQAAARRKIEQAKEELRALKTQATTPAGILPQYRPRIERASKAVKAAIAELDALGDRSNASVVSREASRAAARSFAKRQAAREEHSGSQERGDEISHGQIQSNQLRNDLGDWGGLAHDMLQYVLDTQQQGKEASIPSIAHHYDVKPRTIYNWLHRSDFEEVVKNIEFTPRNNMNNGPT